MVWSIGVHCRLCMYIQQIVGDKTNDELVRNAGVLLLKNVAEKYWRRSAESYFISDDEKLQLRSRLLTLFDEPSSPVTLCSITIRHTLECLVDCCICILICI